MKLAVVGNRKGYTKKYVYKELDTYNLTDEDFIITGGAKGVDTFAMQYAKERGISLIVYYASLIIPIPDRYFSRNFKIAFNCDEMLAFNKKVHSGTTNSINHALHLNKMVKIK